MISTQIKLFAIAGLALVGVFLVLKRNSGFQDVGAAIGGAAVDVGVGAVLGVGDAIGLPRTDETACEKARREGRTWDASFVCPASDFIGYLVGYDIPEGLQAQPDTVSVSPGYSTYGATGGTAFRDW